MPPRSDNAPIGSPCWIDLMTSDTARSREFYGELFGWTAEEPNEEFGGYFNFARDGGLVAGCMANPADSGVPDAWSVYLSTDDARKTVDSATAHKGQIYVAPMDVGDLGTMAVVGDPGGASIGAWQPGLHRGFGSLAELGAPAWFELLTRDYQASVDFYRTVFHWDTHVASDTPKFSYTTLGQGEDTDVALAKVGDLGGATLMAAEDTPYGRLATVSDPSGAAFKLIAGN